MTTLFWKIIRFGITGASGMIIDFGITWLCREKFKWNKYVANTTVPVAQSIAIYKGYGDYGFTRGYLGVGEVFTTASDFWKLRDASLTWNIPQRWVSKTKYVKQASLSIVGRNLLMFLPKENIYTDPEFSNTTGNGVGINTTGNTPPTRSYGATLTVTF